MQCVYCPRCSTENRLEQKFCRQCGLALPAVRLALEGRLVPAVDRLKKNVDTLAGGVVTLFIFACIALINFFFDSGRNWSLFFNLVLGIIISAPLIYRGLKRVGHSIKQVDPGELPGSQTLSDPRAEAGMLPAVPDTDPLQSSLAQPDSVTEDSTLQLPIFRGGNGRNGEKARARD